MAESARTRTSAQPPSHPAAAVPAPRTLHELHALSPSEKDQFAFEQLSTLFDDCKWHDPEHFALLHALTVLRVRLQHRAVTEGGAA